MDAEYWYFVTFWGYMTSTAFFIFGQMVLLVALLKVTKICCLFIPTSSEVYDCNLWYNQIQMPPPISAETSHFVKKKLFGLIPLESGKGYSLKWLMSHYIPKTWLLLAEFALLSLDAYSFIFTMGYVEPKWGMFWFLGVFLISAKTTFTSVMSVETSMATSRARKLVDKTHHAILIALFHNVIMIPLQMSFLDRFYHYEWDMFQRITGAELPAEPHLLPECLSFTRWRDTINFLVFAYMLIRYLFSIILDVDQRLIKRRSHFANLAALTSMTIASIIKKFGGRFAYPESDYHGITVSDNMRIQVDMFMTSTPHRLPLVDWLLFVSLGIFLLSSLVVFIFWLVDKPLPAHDIYTRRTIKDEDEPSATNEEKSKLLCIDE